MHRSVKGLLVILVLSMLGLLLWQLQQEYHQLQDSQRQRSQELAREMSSHLEGSMEFKAQAGLAFLSQSARQPSINPELLDNLRRIYPAMRSIAWLTPVAASPPTARKAPTTPCSSPASTSAPPASPCTSPSAPRPAASCT